MLEKHQYIKSSATESHVGQAGDFQRCSSMSVTFHKFPKYEIYIYIHVYIYLNTVGFLFVCFSAEILPECRWLVPNIYIDNDIKNM